MPCILLRRWNGTTASENRSLLPHSIKICGEPPEKPVLTGSQLRSNLLGRSAFQQGRPVQDYRDRVGLHRLRSFGVDQEFLAVGAGVLASDLSYRPKRLSPRLKT